MSIIAVATNNDLVSEHFGHCDSFALYTIENNAVKEKNNVKNPGHKPGYLPVFLKENKVEVIIAGGMGAKAQKIFKENGIQVYTGISGNCDKTVDEYIKGGLKSTQSVCHEHMHSDECGKH